MSGADRSSVICEVAMKTCSLLREYEAPIIRWKEREFIAISSEVELSLKDRRLFRSQVKKGIAAAFYIQGPLESLLNEITKKAKEADKIALASAIGSYQNVKRPQLKILQLSNRLKAFDGQLFDRFGHCPCPEYDCDSLKNTSNLSS